MSPDQFVMASFDAPYKKIIFNILFAARILICDDSQTKVIGMPPAKYRIFPAVSEILSKAIPVAMNSVLGNKYEGQDKPHSKSDIRRWSEHNCSQRTIKQQVSFPRIIPSFLSCFLPCRKDKSKACSPDVRGERWTANPRSFLVRHCVGVSFEFGTPRPFFSPGSAGNSGLGMASIQASNISCAEPNGHCPRPEFGTFIFHVF